MKLEKTYTYLLAFSMLCIILMVLGIFTIVAMNGLPYFWLKNVAKVEMADGKIYYGEIADVNPKAENGSETKLKVGNRKIYGQDFIWIKDSEIKSVSYPKDLIMLERDEWGNAYGVISEISEKDFLDIHSSVMDEKSVITGIEKGRLLSINEEISKINHLIMKKGETGLEEKLEKFKNESSEIETDLNSKREHALSKTFNLILSDGQIDQLNYYDIVNKYEPNNVSLAGKILISVKRFSEFIFADPRESNTEGGIFPAIFGTVVLVILMSIFVFPLGVIAAVFLSEYAKEGFLVKIIRNTIYNLAGVPSIVYGVFGLGFFVYAVGGSIDRFFFSDYLPSPTFGTGGIIWGSLTLAVLTLPVVIVASLEGLKSVPHMYREGSYSLGSTKWEVIKDVVIPNAMPGMLTGLILAISRAAGEVAPLMMTGVVKSAVSLPFDLSFPFIHLDRKFMHLGFHIYDVGFQSPNIEAARGVVFNTTLILLLIIFALNLTAIVIRNKIKNKLSRSGV
ncbi:MAG: phosphate ABC transporter permease PstA [Spirochaetes bacterium]|nr:phosphate ABC transporter permease PstA [Spirochaetota bacterium]